MNRPLNKSFLLLILIAFSSGVAAQNNCEFDRKYAIAAESGMKMRSEPRVGTPVVTYVMADSIVEACSVSFGQATIEDTLGDWRRVRYKDRVGYMFDGFLRPVGLPAVEPDSATGSSPWVSDSLASDSVFLTTDSLQTEPVHIPVEPAFVWERTERDYIPSTGRLDQQQIRSLASALRKEDLRMDSLIGFLHKLPTKGSQDSVIAWVDAGMPGGRRITSSPVTETTAPDPWEPKPDNNPIGPPPFRLQMATEAYNYCGDIGALDPSMNWYGLFSNEDLDGYDIKRIDLEIVVSKTRLGSQMEFDIRNSSGKVAHFLFGVNRSLDTNKLYQISPERFTRIPPALYPGQQMQAFAQHNRPSAANVFISATGSVVEVGACPVIDNYRLKINTQGPYDEIVQDITPLFPSMGECGMPEMYWFGDLNADNYPELVYVSAGRNRNTFTLLLSNIELDEDLYEVGATWTIESCD